MRFPRTSISVASCGGTERVIAEVCILQGMRDPDVEGVESNRCAFENVGISKSRQRESGRLGR